MRVVLAAATVSLVAAFAAQAGAAAPGPQCGGTLWKQMTLVDSKGINWNPAVTTVGDIARLTSPSRITAARTTPFQKQVWKMNDVVIERYRMASNGEIVFQLYDVPSNTYMNAYAEGTSCMTANSVLRKAMLGARNGFLKHCQAPTKDWQMLGAHAILWGVGFWNPNRSTLGALQSGAELRPLVGLTITQGCGKF